MCVWEHFGCGRIPDESAESYSLLSVSVSESDIFTYPHKSTTRLVSSQALLNYANNGRMAGKLVMMTRQRRPAMLFCLDLGKSCIPAREPQNFRSVEKLSNRSRRHTELFQDMISDEEENN